MSAVTDPKMQRSFDTAIALVTAHIDIDLGGEDEPLWDLLRQMIDDGELEAACVTLWLVKFVTSGVKVMAAQEGLDLREKWSAVCLTAYRDDD